MNSMNLTQAHLRAADILTELYSNLKEDQVLLFQMSNAIWRKVSACHLPQFVFLSICRLPFANLLLLSCTSASRPSASYPSASWLLRAALRQIAKCLVQRASCKVPSVSCPVSHLLGISRYY